MKILSQLFGSPLRVKMMRLFLFNPEVSFDAGAIADKTGARPREIEKEAASLKKIGLAKSVKFSKMVTVKKGKKQVEKRRKVRGYALDRRFPYADALSDFLVRTHSLENKVIVKRIEKAGRIKAILAAGVFTGNPESRLDLFVVGDNVSNASISRVMKGIESDMGKDIRYAVISGPDFAYRVSMNDKLVRDILDFPHMVLLDKIGASPQR